MNSTTNNNDNADADADDDADDEISTTSNNTTTTDSSTTSDSSIYIPTYENELITLSVPPAPSPSPPPPLDNHDDDNDNNDTPKTYTTTQPHHQFEVLTVVPPPLEYMMTLHDEDREISGRQVWCGSFLLCAVLLWREETIPTTTMTSSGSSGSSSAGTTSCMAGGSLIRGKRVLELGSGTGILGMLASKLNPICVAITDGDDQAVKLLQKNLSNPTNDIDEQMTKACALSWGTLTTMEESGDATTAATTAADDNDDTKRGEGFHAWCRTSWPDVYPNVGTAIATTTIATEGVVVEEEVENQDVVFDTIIAGDVMYKPFLPPLFFQTVIQHLSPSNTTSTTTDSDNASTATLYLCHVPRAGITHSIIKNAAQDAGLYVVEEWDVNDVGERFVRGIVEAEDVKRAKVYCMRRRREDGIV